MNELSHASHVRNNLIKSVCLIARYCSKKSHYIFKGLYHITLFTLDVEFLVFFPYYWPWVTCIGTFFRGKDRVFKWVSRYTGSLRNYSKNLETLEPTYPLPVNVCKHIGERLCPHMVLHVTCTLICSVSSTVTIFVLLVLSEKPSQGYWAQVLCKDIYRNRHRKEIWDARGNCW